MEGLVGRVRVLSIRANTKIDEIREKFGFMSILPAETIELKRKYRMEPNGYVLHNPALTK